MLSRRDPHGDDADSLYSTNTTSSNDNDSSNDDSTTSSSQPSESDCESTDSSIGINDDDDDVLSGVDGWNSSTPSSSSSSSSSSLDGEAYDSTCSERGDNNTHHSKLRKNRKNEEKNNHHLNFRQSSFFRQRRKPHHDDDDDDDDTGSFTETMKQEDADGFKYGGIDPNSMQHKGRKRPSRSSGTKIMRSRTRRKHQWFHWSSYLLIFSMLVWTYVQIICYFNTSSILDRLDDLSISGRNNGRSTSIRRPRSNHHHVPIEPSMTIDSSKNHNHPPRPDQQPRNKKEDKEKLKRGCEYPQWQLKQLSTCNVLHEIDLKLFLGRSFSFTKNGQPQQHKYRGRHLDHHNNRNSTTDVDEQQQQQQEQQLSSPGKYLSSGLWRDVWSLYLDYDAPPLSHHNNTAVLKMMKMGT
jgi:hypothetical protein